MKLPTVTTEDSEALVERSCFRAALVLAIAADALQIFVFPLFAEGAFSPADDVLDIVVAAILVNLLGWHWELYWDEAFLLLPTLRWWSASFPLGADSSHATRRVLQADQSTLQLEA